MAKRPLGLGKSAKLKKQKTDTEEVNQVAQTDDLQLTVELDELVDPNDELSQLKALWNTYANSNRDNELMINGLIHECDRILRNEYKDIDDLFYFIYSMSLCELSKFHTDDKETDIEEYFSAAQERVDSGLEKFPDSQLLVIASVNISLQKIMLQYVSKMSIDSNKSEYPKLHKLIDLELSKVSNISSRGVEIELLEFFKLFDDFIDIVSNFGNEQFEGLDSENEEIEEDVGDGVEFNKSHPLYRLQKSIPRYNEWWLENLEKLNTSNTNTSITTEICGLLGKSYLQKLEQPEQIFTTLKYNETEETEIDGMGVDEAQKLAKTYFQKLIPLLTRLVIDSDPQTIVDLAELEISMGNLFEIGSDEQERYYSQAEIKLRKLNNITHGKYQDILESISK